jgi:hypothetical protein
VLTRSGDHERPPPKGGIQHDRPNLIEDQAAFFRDLLEGGT